MSKYRYVVECFLCNNNSCFRIRILDLIYFLYMFCVVSYCITCCILTMSSAPLASTCLAHAPSWDESKNKLMVENRSTTPQRGGSGGGATARKEDRECFQSCHTKCGEQNEERRNRECSESRQTNWRE
jgi:hypothetical protein